MSNILGVVIGVIVIAVGVILLICWWPMFIKGLMATLPILLILIGAGVLLYFISEIKSKLDVAKDDPPAESK
jgi:xanthine/uracil permease